MYRLFKKYQEIVMYILIGVCTTAVSLVSYFILANLYEVHYQEAKVASWVFSVMFAYFTNKLFVFKSEYAGIKETMIEIGKFVLCRVSSLMIEIASMIFFVQVCGLDDNSVKLMDQVIVLIINYIFSKFLVFQKI